MPVIASSHHHCSQEELHRHTVWVANRQYIEDHNTFSAEKTGFILAMNQFGDLVSSAECHTRNLKLAMRTQLQTCIWGKNATC